MMHLLRQPIIFLLIHLAPCLSEEVLMQRIEVVDTTENQDYIDDELILKVQTYNDWVIVRDMEDIARNFSIVGITKFDEIHDALFTATTKKGRKKFDKQLKENEIEQEKIITLEELAITDETLDFSADMLINNNDPELYDFSKVWDVDTITNYINETTFVHPWMEVIDLNTTSQDRKIKVIKVSRYPDNTWGERNTHVFMSSWSGAQWLSIRTVLNMLGKVAKYADDVYDLIHPLVTRSTLYFIPLPNPDGYHHSYTKPNRFWSKNMNTITKNQHECIGVNLELNACKTVNGTLATKICNLDFDGKEPFSEQETVSIRKFAEKIIAENTKALPIHWFQFEELSSGLLVPPFAKGVVKDPLPNVTGVLENFKSHDVHLNHNAGQERGTEEEENTEPTNGNAAAEEMQNDDAQKLLVPNKPRVYTAVRGQDFLSPVPESSFLDELVEMGVKQTYSVGVPLSLEEHIRPVGERAAENIEQFAGDLLRAVDQLARPVDRLEPFLPLLVFLQFFLFIGILITAVTITLKMHDNTILREQERAMNAVKVPDYVLKAGAFRKYKTTVGDKNTAINRVPRSRGKEIERK